MMNDPIEIIMKGICITALGLQLRRQATDAGGTFDNDKTDLIKNIYL